MKETILDLYDIDVVSFIKVSNKVYRMKTETKDYMNK